MIRITLSPSTAAKVKETIQCVSYESSKVIAKLRQRNSLNETRTSTGIILVL